QGRRRSRGCTTPCPGEWHARPAIPTAYAPAAFSMIDRKSGVAGVRAIVLELRLELGCAIEETIKRQPIGPWRIQINHARRPDGTFTENARLAEPYEVNLFPPPIELFDISPTLKLVWQIKDEPATVVAEPDEQQTIPYRKHTG